MRTAGYSLVEMVVTLAAIVALAALATPSLLAARDEARARSAAGHLGSLLHLARVEALKRHVHVALRFDPADDDFLYAMYADGNGNGVRTSDIQDGADARIRPPERLAQQCPGVRFAVDAGVVGLEGESLGAGGPVRVGTSRMVSFSPLGTSTSGTIYLLGRAHRQLAVRVLGPTGRIRTFEYNHRTSTWRPR